MSNLHPIFADILARHMQLPGMNIKNAPESNNPDGNRRISTVECQRNCPECGKGPVPNGTQTLNGQRGRWHPKCFRKAQAKL